MFSRSLAEVRHVFQPVLKYSDFYLMFEVKQLGNYKIPASYINQHALCAIISMHCNRAQIQTTKNSNFQFGRSPIVQLHITWNMCFTYSTKDVLLLVVFYSCLFYLSDRSLLTTMTIVVLAYLIVNARKLVRCFSNLRNFFDCCVLVKIKQQ